MRILIVPDKFKGSLTAHQAALPLPAAGVQRDPGIRLIYCR